MGFEWLKAKYKDKKQSGSSTKGSGDEPQYVEDLTYGEYVTLIEQYSDEDSENLFDIAEAIRHNEKLSEWEKEKLWDLIDEKWGD